VLYKGVCAPSVGMHGPNSIADALSRSVAEDCHARVPLGPAHFQVGPDVLAAEIVAGPTGLARSGEEMDAVSGTESE
jgi:hypothetical protein